MPLPLAVIIPTINEASTLPALLAELKQQTGVILEVWVSDGGSSDDTVALARTGGAQVIEGDVGRGAQMNRAHLLALSPMRLFLHADSRFTRRDQLQRALQHWEAEGGRGRAGHFPLRFADAPANRPRLFAFMEAKTRSGRPGTIHGDQGLLIHRDDFDALGRYVTRRPYFEDVYFSETVFRQARWTLLPDPVITSARRFTGEGPTPRYALMGLMMALHAAGDDGFFDAMQSLYRQQDQTRELALAPYFRLAFARLLRRPDRWPRLLLYGVANAWQLPLMLRIWLFGARG